jgi:hypothetical protein
MFLAKCEVAKTLAVVIAGFGLRAWEADAAAQTKESVDLWARPLLIEQFDATHKLIKPQPGESRWMQIDWLTSLWDARVKAAAAGKPIFVWNGSGGAPMCPT